MQLRELRLTDFRLFEAMTLDLAPGWSVFVGPNGAGKTSIVEAAYLLSHGRSFRPGARDALVRRGADGYVVHGRVERAGGREHRLGLGAARERLEARVDGERASLGELLDKVAILCFEPGSHELIAGGSAGRRAFLDWGVFHVEPSFLVTWRRYQRALRQRNVLLKRGADDGALEPWEIELAISGEPIAEMRARYADSLRPLLSASLIRILNELGEPSLTLDRGWSQGADLIEALAAGRARDRARGHTSAGPHRADWQLVFEGAPRREHLSRGQEKLCALACVLAQGAAYADRHGEWPVLCFDDLASELDPGHQQAVVDFVAGLDAQVLLTGTERPSWIAALHASVATFHVEQGAVSALL